ncbi:MAG: alpha-galactosidase [Clostridiales bacterium]|nr:alpha-galactosidase [Clostridiales bacterium]
MIYIHEFENGQKLFHIQTISTSYVMMVHQTGHLIQLHYGKRVEDSEHLLELYQNYATELGSSTLYDGLGKLTLDTAMLELSSFGKGDYRTPSIELEFNDGSRVSDFTYLEHIRHVSKNHPSGMPHIIEAEGVLETLEISLFDKVKNIEVKLYYTPVTQVDVIVRRLEVINHSNETVIIHKIHSFNLDFNHSKFELVTLDGLWIRERQINKGPLRPGVISIDSKKGVSGANHNPFIGLLGQGTNEKRGDCYGFALIYSGNFSGNVEVSPYGMTRLQMGISDFDFRWKIESGASFDTPEAVMTYSKEGTNRMSQNFHSLINKHLIGEKWQNTPRPVLINNWEATYFDFNMAKLVKLAKVAKSVGIELFVLDDGWFKGRNDDKSSLGDWTCDMKKLPGGLKALSDRLKGLGLEFGIWVEPEMVSIDSDLYKAHPEWAIKLRDRTPSLGRNQLILDLTNPDVVDYLYESLVSVFESADISYVKWDMTTAITWK